MKVYVDDNEDYRITYSSRDGSECLESMGMQPIIVESLADYTKQVRKEVCEQIKAEFDTSGFNKIGASLYPPTEEAMWMGKGFNACKERLFKKLDEIEQGETK